MKKLLGVAFVGVCVVGSANAQLPFVRGTCVEGDCNAAWRSFVCGYAVGLLNVKMDQVYYKASIIANSADQFCFKDDRGWGADQWIGSQKANAEGAVVQKLGRVRTVVDRVLGTAAGNKCGLETRRLVQKYGPVMWAKAKKFVKKFADTYCQDDPVKVN